MSDYRPLPVKCQRCGYWAAEEGLRVPDGRGGFWKVCRSCEQRYTDAQRKGY